MKLVYISKIHKNTYILLKIYASLNKMLKTRESKKVRRVGGGCFFLITEILIHYHCL